VDVFFGGFVSVWILAAAVPVGLVVLGIVALVGNRGQDDPAGQRATAVYFGVVLFLTLFTVLFAGTAAVGTAASFLVPAEDRDGPTWDSWTGYEPGLGVVYEDGFPVEDGPGDRRCFPDCEVPDEVLDEVDDATVRETVTAGLIALPAAAILLFHLRRRRGLLASEGFVGSPAWRADRVFLHLVCIVALAAAAFAVAALVYDLFRVVAPDITSTRLTRASERERGVADGLAMGLLALGAAAIFFAHWSQLSGEGNPLRRFWPFGRSSADDPGDDADEDAETTST
jgi:hypothetical protein